MPGYCPLVGILSSPNLHAGDQALRRLMSHRTGLRGTAEKSSFLSRWRDGGIQFASVVEAVVSGVATDVRTFLNRSFAASQLTTDELHLAMSMQLAAVEKHKGLVVSAYRPLAGYGIFVKASTGRSTPGTLDAPPPHQGENHNESPTHSPTRIAILALYDAVQGRTPTQCAQR